jgi:uncharacterized repeat protein (TIGR04042 family)
VPEVLFTVRWPDDSTDECYSPSLVVEEFFEPGVNYPLDAFVDLSRQALTEASQRVRARYGFLCSRAEAQLSEIERRAGEFQQTGDVTVTVEEFHRC